jgi:hypothetical protein
VSQSVLTAAPELLEKVAFGVGDSEIDRLVEALREALRGDNDAEGFEKFQLQVSAIRQALQHNALSERGLNVLIDTTHDLSSTLSLQDLLRTIVVRARNLVGADVAWVTVLDAESEIFRVVTADGHLSPETAVMTSRIDHGAVSLVMNSKSFFETPDYLSDQRFRHAPHLDDIFEPEKIQTLAGFPILWENKVHGLLFVANRYARKLGGGRLRCSAPSRCMQALRCATPMPSLCFRERSTKRGAIAARSLSTFSGSRHPRTRMTSWRTCSLRAPRSASSSRECRTGSAGRFFSMTTSSGSTRNSSAAPTKASSRMRSGPVESISRS